MAGGDRCAGHWEIRITGVVQGVGFRPFVYRVARELGVRGSVSNRGGCVIVRADADAASVERLVAAIRAGAPPRARIEGIAVGKVADMDGGKDAIRDTDGGEDAIPRRVGAADEGDAGLEGTALADAGMDGHVASRGATSGAREAPAPLSDPIEGFVILPSGEIEEDARFLSPDIACCDACMADADAAGDRREAYPLITCAQCGPRFSILDRLPYDREHTSMAGFEMCPACRGEYESPEDRRFHAETISCPRCGPRVWYRARGGDGDGAVTHRGEAKDATMPGVEAEDAITPGGDAEDATTPGGEAKGMSQRHDMPEAVMACASVPSGKTGGAARSRLHETMAAEGSAAVERAAEAIRAGAVIAVKGTGGYHYACSAVNPAAVESLRRIKARDQKPFAVMFADVDSLRRICAVSQGEEALLRSWERPIVLLDLNVVNGDRRGEISTQGPQSDAQALASAVTQGEITAQGPHSDAQALASAVTQGDSRCGAFLPYTTLHQMLADRAGPIVLTSANRGGEAILTDDARALGLPVPVLWHQRPILRPVEDSVAQWTPGGRQLLRRSRGFVPAAFRVAHDHDRAFLALGGDLKAVFALARAGIVWPSAHYGDLENRDVFDRYRAGIQDLRRLLGIEPEFAVCDGHPRYHSAALARELGLPVVAVQHHHAHVASVIAEHGLAGRVVGMAFDGTGYGEDGACWGGEFLVCEGAGMRRAGHLADVRLVGGDAAAREANRTAVCYLLDAGLEREANALDLGGSGPDRGGTGRALFMAAWRQNINAVASSSIGRLFDAVAALCGVCARNDYEGQCAIRLQQCAERALREGTPAAALPFPVHGHELDPRPLIRAIVEARRAGRGADGLALGFHMALAEAACALAARIAQEEQIRTVVLSGGSFQNRLLSDQIEGRLRGLGFAVYQNRESPPGDGGIALGQAYLGGLETCASR